MSTFQYLVGDLIALCCGIYYGTGLLRASKVSKLQAARVSLRFLPAKYCPGTD